MTLLGKYPPGDQYFVQRNETSATLSVEVEGTDGLCHKTQLCLCFDKAVLPRHPIQKYPHKRQCSG